MTFKRGGSIPMQTRYARLSAVVIFGVLGDPAVGRQETIDMHLENAGFTMRMADTPERMAVLRRLPPHKFVGRKKGGTRYFIYADPDYCKCVFLGDAQALQDYRDIASAGLPVVDNLPPTGYEPVHDMIEDIDDDLGIGEDDFLEFTVRF
jgi:hypothetical protein